MSNKSSSASGGVGIFSLLAVLFIGLKLGGVIDWSWWWVTFPLWGPLTIGIVGGLVFLLGLFVVSMFPGK
jgi:hypothetical protein